MIGRVRISHELFDSGTCGEQDLFIIYLRLFTMAKVNFHAVVCLQIHTFTLISLWEVCDACLA